MGLCVKGNEMAITLKINTGSKAFDLEPALNGIEESQEKIWSKNTGRTSSGKMTGDIVTTKLKLKIKYPVLTIEQKNLLNKAISDAFFTVEYQGAKYKMYANSPTYPLYSMATGLPRYVGVAVDLIEQ
jgi:hypothetical protein